MKIAVQDDCRGDLFYALVVGLYFLIAADAAGGCIRPSFPILFLESMIGGGRFFEELASQKDPFH